MKIIRNKIYIGSMLFLMMFFIMYVPINASEMSGDEDIIDWEKSTFTATAGQNDTIEWHLKMKEDYQNGEECPLRIYNFCIQIPGEEGIWYVYPKLSKDGSEWVGSYALSDYGTNGTYEILGYSYEVYSDCSEHTITFDNEWGNCVVSGLKSEMNQPIIDLTKAKVYGAHDNIYVGDTVHFLIPASDAESGVRTVWFTTYRLINETDCEYCFSMNIDVDSSTVQRVDDGYVFSMPIEKPGTYMVLDYQAMDMCHNYDGVEIVSLTRDEDGTYHYEKRDEYKQYFDQLTYTVYEKQLSATSVDGEQLYLNEGEGTELEVIADCKDDSIEITYQWYIKEKDSDEWGVIENATESNYHVMNAKKTMDYKCLVKASNGEEVPVFYTISVEKLQHLYSENTEGYYLIDKNREPETIALKPAVYSDIETTLHYKWYYQDYDEENATELITTVGDTCQVDTFQINKKRFYTCDVSAEIDGETEHLLFTYEFAIDSGLDYTRTIYNTIYVEQGDSKEIDARDYYDISDEYKEGITYQWYLWEDDMIEGEDVPTIKSEPVTEKVRYSVVIKDMCGNDITVHIDLCINAGFSAEENHVTLYVEKGKTVTLTPFFEINYDCKDTLDYDWFVDNDWIETEEGISLITEPITSDTYYEARISDKYGNVYYFYYDIFIDTGLSVDESIINVSAKKGERVELKAPTVFIYDGYKYSFQWRTLSPGALYAIDIGGQTKDTLVIDSAKENMVYYLFIEDDYGNSQSVKYNLTVMNDNVGDKNPQTPPDANQGTQNPTGDITVNVPGNSNPKPAGTKMTDPQGNGTTYTVTSADSSAPTVAFNGVEDENAKEVTIPKTVTIDGVTYSVTTVSIESFEKKDNGAKYHVTDNSVNNLTIEYTGTSKKNQKSVSIPQTVTYKGIKFKVTSVKAKSFKGNKKITTVKIASGVTKIGNSTFEGCSNLKNVTLGKSVTTIGKNAFKNCKKLTKITIKSSKLKSVGKNTLKGVNEKCKIKVPAKKVSAYTKLFKNKGQKKITIKK